VSDTIEVEFYHKIIYNYIVKHKFFLLFLSLMLFCAAAGFAAGEENFESGDFWVCPGVDIALYSSSGISYGGGVAIGYGRGSSIGLKITFFPGQKVGDTMFFQDSSDGISVLEINCLLRFYFFGKKAYSGPFMQINGGPVLFYSPNSEDILPAKAGAFTFGAGFGWRFLLFDRVFIEPSVRAGYPYLVGAGISAGVRF